MIQVETGTMIVSGRSDWPNRGEERRRIEISTRICLTWFTFVGLGKPKLYQNMGNFTMWGGFYLDGSEYWFKYWI